LTGGRPRPEKGWFATPDSPARPGRHLHADDTGPPDTPGWPTRTGHGSRERFHDKAFDAEKRRRGHAQTAPEFTVYLPVPGGRCRMTLPGTSMADEYTTQLRATATTLTVLLITLDLG